METDSGMESQDSTPDQGQVAPDQDGAVENSPQQTDSTPGENPAWASFKEALDPMSFERVKPLLAKSDKDVQSRFDKIHEQYKPFKDLVDNEVDPERVKVSLNLAQQVEQDPEFVFNSLKEFLQRNGRMPEDEQELAEDVEDQQQEQEEQDDPRIAQLEQWAHQQEQEKLASEADTWLDSELSRVQKEHPELTETDIREVLERATTHATRTGEELQNLDPFVKSVLDYQQNILTRPRPGDSAPNLVPSGGGIPQQQNQKTLGQLSSNEVQNTLASLTMKANQAGR